MKQRRNHRGLVVEQVEQRLCLSAIGFTPHLAPPGDRPQLVDVADINGDGHLEVVIVQRVDGSDSVSWYSNLQGTFIPPSEAVDVPLSITRDMAIADVDGDGDVDIIFGGSGGLSWHENADGLGNFTAFTHVGGGDDLSIFEIVTGDFDGDGDLDVASLGYNSDGFSELWWRENMDGLGSFGPRIVIETELFGTESLAVGDIDGNGFPDLVSVSKGLFLERVPAEVFWYANNDGIFSAPIEVLAEGVFAVLPRQAFLEDVDGDDDLDLVVTNLGQIGWSENLDGEGDFGPARTIAAAIGGPAGTKVQIVDLDADGDIDILSASHTGSLIASPEGSYEIVWHENMDGRGTFADAAIVVFSSPSSRFLVPADVDGDGDIDIVTAPWEWYESDLIQAPTQLVGDINQDKEVSFADFLILSANFGKQDATADEGDINLDGQVDFSDFLLLSANFGKRQVD